eukprot:TRINITY_DN3288_c0_g1_i1.p2 TRINITY_DN3288_c0_g1~~TRINITY_DN3288_c0_g1_i1.p2  ORF type:complete len:124 (-),score=11.73 TRINITY_DN3288_c0_g1_i1:75-446(-)
MGCTHTGGVGVVLLGDSHSDFSDDSDTSPVYLWNEEAWGDITYDLLNEGHNLDAIQPAIKASHGDLDNARTFLHLMDMFSDMHPKFIKIALVKANWNLNESVTLLTEPRFTKSYISTAWKTWP